MTSAAELDAADVLAEHRSLFVRADDVIAYLDGNSLGRPLKASGERIAAFIEAQWGVRLIRGWDEGWLALPGRIGDDLGRVALGAGSGQVTIGDSTTVLLYKLIRAAVTARPGRTEIVIDRDNFPTDRYIVEGIAAELGMTVCWIDAADAVSIAAVATVVGANTAAVVLSHVAYRSGYIADAAGITSVAHDAGALVVLDLCHSVGVVPVELDAWGVDLAVGCTYKYLNGGPGAPAFAYVRADLQAELRQPIQGWIGSATPFEM
ncbi:MAG TPA: aminotransferase class V-fold PLP-dependent enzyme, partial [Galbitalea sp.]|nr:aminotransferase class V-fold PLP-dependent enzyme [Galbitalea sp.]